MIEFKDITKSCCGKELLCGASLSVEKGGIHGIIGASEKAVSALLGVICGALDFDGGDAEVCGFDMATSAKNAQKRVGYMPDPLVFYEDMTAFEHLLFVGEAKSVASDKLYKNIKSTLELVGLEAKADRLISKLSSTETKRLGLATAMLGNPDLIVLNEPTAGMPKRDEKEMLELIKKLGGVKTVVIASSDIEVIESVCDAVTIIASGKVIADGRLEDIKSRLAKNKALRLTVKGSERAVVEKISGIRAVTDCTVRPGGAGAVMLTVEYDNNADIREEIFSLLAKAGMPILSMEDDHIGLSELYAKLCEGEEEGKKE